MYTEERLRSKFNIGTYRYFGETSLKEFTKAENIINQLKDNNNSTIKINENSYFTINDEILTYCKYIPLNDCGKYLNISIAKTHGHDTLNIILEYGIKEFDLTTQEKYDRKLAKVGYTYENKNVYIYDVKDELYYNKLEEEKKEEIRKRVLTLKE